MQDQPIDADARLADDEVERAVLALLLAPGLRGPWSAQELGLEVGSELVATAAVIRLHAAGLVHLCHGFVWATRPAARVHELIGTA
jgi:hypothetical protein